MPHKKILVDNETKRDYKGKIIAAPMQNNTAFSVAPADPRATFAATLITFQSSITVELKIRKVVVEN